MVACVSVYTIAAAIIDVTSDSIIVTDLDYITKLQNYFFTMVGETALCIRDLKKKIHPNELNHLNRSICSQGGDGCWERRE